MKLVIGVFLLVLTLGQASRAQTNDAPNPDSVDTRGTISRGPEETYIVYGATSEQEEALRAQIQQMRPEVLPNRIVFVPHWKYLDNARIFQLHVPTGFASVMFTHLPSRTVFVDNDRYLGPEWLGYWMAHELGHLASSSAKEEDAEKVAKKLRLALKRGIPKG